MACAVAENLRHFSAPTSRACSITVNSVGPSFTRGLDASFINRWSKKEQTVHAVCRSDGERRIGTHQKILMSQVFTEKWDGIKWANGRIARLSFVIVFVAVLFSFSVILFLTCTNACNSPQANTTIRKKHLNLAFFTKLP